MDRVSKAERELVRKMQRQTNADRIRSMTDEELSQFLSNLSANGCEYDGCPARHGCEAFSVKTCKEQMKNWLKQEAENES